MLLRALIDVPRPAVRRRVEAVFEELEIAVLSATRDELPARVEQVGADLVVTVEDLGGDPAGRLGALRGTASRPEVVVLTAGAGLPEMPGVSQVPADAGDDELRSTLGLAARRRAELVAPRVRPGVATPGAQAPPWESKNAGMNRVLSIARRVSRADSSLLLLGETGVGKEWLARSIHAWGPRAQAPFVAVNCAAVPDSLLESELFGFEAGAFTGAVRARRGYFELAHRGTLFLDEIGDTTPHLQSRLLRVLQDHKVQRLGGEKEIAVDVRVMASTNRDLAAEMARGRFRADLYYRLAVVSLELPPLRERSEDVEALVEHSFDRSRIALRRLDLTGLQADARAALVAYAWPGNVRELINVIERAVLLAPGPEIALEDLPAEIAHPGAARAGVGKPDFERLLDRPLKDATRELVTAFERRYLDRLLTRNRGHLGDTAASAGIESRTLYDKMRALGLQREPYLERTRRRADEAAAAALGERLGAPVNPAEGPEETAPRSPSPDGAGDGGSGRPRRRG